MGEMLHRSRSNLNSSSGQCKKSGTWAFSYRSDERGLQPHQHLARLGLVLLQCFSEFQFLQGYSGMDRVFNSSQGVLGPISVGLREGWQSQIRKTETVVGLGRLELSTRGLGNLFQRFR